jgi:uncharacterized membrane protein
MPIHWNASGQVDGYAGKTFAALFTPTVNIAMALLISVLALIDPRVRKSDPDTHSNFRKTFKIIRLAITCFMSVVSLAVICIGAGYALDMSRIICIGFALLFGVLGNFMGKLRPNYVVGIRTPWTLESPEVWIKTHRLTGRLMVAASILLLIACLVFPPSIYVWFTTAIVLLVALISILYSFLAYKRQQHQPL